MILYLTHHTQYICEEFVESQLKLPKGYFEAQFKNKTASDAQVGEQFEKIDHISLEEEQTKGLKYQDNPLSLRDNL